jgi:hypothetical protein
MSVNFSSYSESLKKHDTEAIGHCNITAFTLYLAAL